MGTVAVGWPLPLFPFYTSPNTSYLVHIPQAPNPSVQKNEHVMPPRKVPKLLNDSSCMESKKTIKVKAPPST